MLGTSEGDLITNSGISIFSAEQRERVAIMSDNELFLALGPERRGIASSGKQLHIKVS